MAPIITVVCYAPRYPHFGQNYEGSGESIEKMSENLKS